MPDIETQEKQKKFINWENISAYIFYALIFLLPIFILPFTFDTLAFSKAILVYCFIGLIFLLWIFTSLQKGYFVFPKSLLLAVLGIIAVVSLISSFASQNIKLSLIGFGYEIGTFLFFIFMFVAAFMASILFQSNKKVFVLYILLFASAVLVFIFQAIQISPIGLASNLEGIFPFKTSNLLGSWNDFAIFFGLIALSAIALFDLFNFNKKIKITLLVLTAISLLAMAAVNFLNVWYIFAVMVLILFVYTFWRRSFDIAQENSETNYNKKFVGLSLFIFILAFFFIIAHGFLGNLAVFLGTDTVEIHPSWQQTYEISYNTLKNNLFLGSGPNTFIYNWLKFKPISINSTDFWNVGFNSGTGQLPSMVSTMGILGGLAIISFILVFVFCGFKAMTYSSRNTNINLLPILFLNCLYLWLFTIFYSPGFVIFALAFILTGVFVGMLVFSEKIKKIEVSFLKNQKIGFISVLIGVFLMLFTVFGIYILCQKYWAAYNYTNALKIINTEEDFNKSETIIANAIRFDPQDVYYRTFSEIEIMKMQKILSQQTISDDTAGDLQTQFQNALSAAIQSAQLAIKENKLNPSNWMQLSRVYELIAPLGVNGAKELAIDNYNKALEISPNNPMIYLKMAIVEAQAGNFDKAREYANMSLNIKQDYQDAINFLQQIKL
ncbi:MAG: hypothetical protein ABIJ84_01755 [bacterium]